MGSNHVQSRMLDDADGLTHLPPSEVRAQTERIVSSQAFAGSERLCRFLTWTVEQSLRGESAGIKQYVIGCEVFDRGADFDPRIDSIVRTEAQRLRRKLSEYYRNGGLSDPILISIEPGSYVPVFKRRQQPSTPKRSNRIEAVPKTNRWP